MERRKNLWDYVCHMWLLFVCMRVLDYVHIHRCLSHHNLRSEPQVTKNSVPRNGTKEEPMGLCLPFEAVVYVIVHGLLAILFEVLMYNR